MNVEIAGRTLATRVLFSETEILSRVEVLAQEIEASVAAHEELVVLIVLDGAIVFASDLIRRLGCVTSVETVKLKSYHGMESTGAVKVVQGVPNSLSGKNILVVEDIVDSGRSLRVLRAELERVGVASVRVVCLLDKPESHLEDVHVDFVGFSVGKNFVIGYGLDADGRYRNLPYIAEVIL